MNPTALIKLFKPYKLNFTSVNDFFDNCKGDESLLMDALVDIECSASKNRMCGNTDCAYNMVKHHNDELYLEIVNGGG